MRNNQSPQELHLIHGTPCNEAKKQHAKRATLNDDLKCIVRAPGRRTFCKKENAKHENIGPQPLSSHLAPSVPR